MKPADAPRLTEWMSATEIAEHFGVTRTTVNEMIRAGEFETLRLAGKQGARPSYMVARSEVEGMSSTRAFPRAKSEAEPV